MLMSKPSANHLWVPPTPVTHRQLMRYSVWIPCKTRTQAFVHLSTQRTGLGSTGSYGAHVHTYLSTLTKLRSPVENPPQAAQAHVCPLSFLIALPPRPLGSIQLVGCWLLSDTSVRQRLCFALSSSWPGCPPGLPFPPPSSPLVLG